MEVELQLLLAPGVTALLATDAAMPLASLLRVALGTVGKEVELAKRRWVLLLVRVW